MAAVLSEIFRMCMVKGNCYLNLFNFHPPSSGLPWGGFCLNFLKSPNGDSILLFQRALSSIYGQPKLFYMTPFKNGKPNRKAKYGYLSDQACKSQKTSPTMVWISWNIPIICIVFLASGHADNRGALAFLVKDLSTKVLKNLTKNASGGMRSHEVWARYCEHRRGRRNVTNTRPSTVAIYCYVRWSLQRKRKR